MTYNSNVQPLKAQLSWSLLYQSRKRVRKTFPSIWKIPVRKKVNQVLKSLLTPGCTVLDIGACSRNLERFVKKWDASTTYKSMDIDRELYHDYYDMADIEEKFDIVVMYECIEHMDISEGYQCLREIYRVLKPGGVVLLSTPNTFHPNRYWECTHKNPFRYDELAGLIELSGFNTDAIYRIYNDAFHRRWFRMLVAAPLHRYLEIDFARSILVQSRKPANAASDATPATIPFIFNTSSLDGTSEKAVGI